MSKIQYQSLVPGVSLSVEWFSGNPREKVDNIEFSDGYAEVTVRNTGFSKRYPATLDIRLLLVNMNHSGLQDKVKQSGANCLIVPFPFNEQFKLVILEEETFKDSKIPSLLIVIRTTIDDEVQPDRPLMLRWLVETMA